MKKIVVKPLKKNSLKKIDAYWRACKYVAAGMLLSKGKSTIT